MSPEEQLEQPVILADSAKSRGSVVDDMPLMYDAEQQPDELFRDLYILELANNHQGQVEHGLKIIQRMAKIARQYGIRAAAKLQYRDLDTFIHPDYKYRTDIPHIPRFLSTRLSSTDFETLVQAIHDEGLISIVTPFDERSVDRCMDHGVEIIKVASCSATDWPLLEKVSETGRPLIVSTGGLDLYSIDSIVSFFEHRNCRIGLMHCVALYPTPDGAAQMHFLDRLARRYPRVPVGYSGHEAPDNLDIVKVAVAKGAFMLERHVGLPTDNISLNAYSMDPKQVERWVETSLKCRRICGQASKKAVTQAEFDSLRSLQRGVFAKRRIATGETLKTEDVFYAMPCRENQLTSGQFGRYRATYRASRDYWPGDAVFEQAQTDDISRIRGVVHDIKGMLHEAKICVGHDFGIELSHHYGLNEFHRTGAVIITMVNRTYCKKLVILLPGQRHPPHWHRVKEETFQLLWGDMEATVEGERHRLVRGDTLLVRPGQVHSFRSCGGAIFEEISTHHQRKDSFYEDAKINSMDPLERKTLLQDW
jgi:sialic acid synthase SpsE/mannose-6-phosphate isomerase-like protein (cupin superfamily)